MDEIPFDVDGRLSAAYRRMVAEMREEAEMEIGDGDDDAEEALAGNVDGGEGERGRMAQLGEVMEAQHLVCGKVNGKPIALSPEDIEEMYQDYKNAAATEVVLCRSSRRRRRRKRCGRRGSLTAHEPEQKKQKAAIRAAAVALGCKLTNGRYKRTRPDY